jgi:hypothetical protein
MGVDFFNCPDRSWCVANSTTALSARRHWPGISQFFVPAMNTSPREEKGKALLEKGNTNEQPVGEL